MTEQRSALAQIFIACWKDEEFKARFMADPKAVLSEYGMDVPEKIEVKVVENTDNCMHITLPAAPAGEGELSDEELSLASGGGWKQCWPGAWGQGTGFLDTTPMSPCAKDPATWSKLWKQNFPG